MITARTPAKKATDRTPPRDTDGEKAGPSRTSPQELTSKVRRSIEGWESTLADPKPCTSTSHAHANSPKKAVPVPPAPQKQRAKPALSAEARTTRRASVETAAVSPGQKLEAVRTADRVTQARIWLQRAKTQIGESRNLRADLKSGITLAVDKLYQLVKEATADTSAAPGKEKREEISRVVESGKEEDRRESENGTGIDGKELMKLVKEQTRKIDQTNEELNKLRQSICTYQDVIEKQTTYASIAATSPRNPVVERKSALHSIVIESKDEAATGDDVINQVREAVNAKDGWVTIERVRKVKDKKVILGCRTIEDRDRVKERLKGASDRLNFEDMKNHDPMVILRDVMTHHTDNDIKTAIRSQNGVVFRGLDGKDDRLEVKFRPLNALYEEDGRHSRELKCSIAEVVPAQNGAGDPTRGYAAAQTNLQRKELATTELMVEASRRKLAFALVQEPYVGGRKRMKDYRGARVYQNASVGDGTVKAAIVVFDADLDVIQCPKLTTDNIVVVRIRTSAWEIAAVSFYFEPDQPIGPYLDQMRNVVEVMGPRRLLIGGDSNAKSTWWGSTFEDHRGADMSGTLEESGLQVLNRGNVPTFETVRGGRRFSSRVDITACTEDLLNLVHDWKVDRGMITSDHNSITFKVDLTASKGLKVIRTTRRYNTKKTDWELFGSALTTAKTARDLNVLTISQIENSHQIEEAAINFTNAITEACKTSMPAKKNTEVLKIPWWSDELNRLKKIMVTYRRKIRNAALHHRESAVTEYLKKKTEYEEQAKLAQIASWKDFCSKQDRESVWDGIYRVIKRTTNRAEDLNLTKDGRQLNTLESANYVAETFYPHDQEEGETEYHREVRLRAQIVNKYKSDETLDPLFTIKELKTAIGSFNPKKAPGEDGFTADICSRAILQDPDAFLALYNRCLLKGYFPKIWKKATVVVLRKPGKDDYTNPKAYRPIGLLPVLGKVLEKMLIARVKWHLIPRISTRQYGFMPQKSTEDALYTLVHRIKGKMELKKLVTLVSLDIEGAFDSAWWPAIRIRLAEEKCPVNLRRMLDSYLEHRGVMVRYAGEEVPRSTNKGCVQGSIGGPILWNLLLDPLLQELERKGHYVQAFADDVVLMFDGNTALDIEREANTALSYIEDWGAKNKLRFAPHKTCAMVMTRKLKFDNPRLKMGGVDIALSKQVKILGLHIDHKLTFNKHVGKQTSKALDIFKQVSRAAKINWGLHPEIVRLIYVAAVEPIILYAASAWAPAADKIGVQKLLNSVQRGFAQKLCKSYRTVSLHSALTLAGILPLDLRIQEAAALYETKRGSPLPELGDRETESRVGFAETPHPALHMDIIFERLEDQSLVDRHNVQEVRIFTDGSKIEGKVGAALSVWKGESEVRNQKFSLSAYCTVYQAELLAICRATGGILKGRERSYGLYSDSMAALETVANHSSLHPLAVESRENLRKALTQGKDVSLYWIKAHAGLQGNERADELAKEAALALKKKPDYDKCPVSFAKKSLRNRSIIKWNERYKVGETASITKIFFPDAGGAYRLVRKIRPTGLLTQILTGHGGFSQYLHRFKCGENPSCDCDPDIHQTVPHLLSNCPIFDQLRFDFEQKHREKITEAKYHELIGSKSTRDEFIVYCEKICAATVKKNKSS
ncbi:hypothetical protein ABMA28_005482 [Loxostege sticticalis]|uniref:Retrovirus-related Pol polyprotein from type-1 retrotransposable element R1 n=1 Tax=Loxostege sticticalis TaxID=481309 RepID=A0ABD0SQK1_LOXSC